MTEFQYIPQLLVKDIEFTPESTFNNIRLPKIANALTVENSTGNNASLTIAANGPAGATSNVFFSPWRNRLPSSAVVAQDRNFSSEMFLRTADFGSATSPLVTRLSLSQDGVGVGTSSNNLPLIVNGPVTHQGLRFNNMNLTLIPIRLVVPSVSNQENQVPLNAVLFANGISTSNTLRQFYSLQYHTQRTLGEGHINQSEYNSGNALRWKIEVVSGQIILFLQKASGTVDTDTHITMWWIRG